MKRYCEVVRQVLKCTFLQDWFYICSISMASVSQCIFYMPSIYSHDSVVTLFTFVSEGKIPDLLAEGSVDSMTKLVLVNAIYFKANWAEKFQEADTTDAPFRLNKVIQIRPGRTYLMKRSNNIGGNVKHCLQMKYFKNTK